jgi:hypothetical protein
MVGNQDRWHEDIFVACPLRDLVPDDHVLERVDRVLDLARLRVEVADCYCSDNGRPSIDPESALRLMLAGFFAGIVHDWKLMREAQVNLAMRWFAGYRLHEQLPGNLGDTLFISFPSRPERDNHLPGCGLSRATARRLWLASSAMTASASALT